MTTEILKKTIKKERKEHRTMEYQIYPGHFELWPNTFYQYYDNCHNTSEGPNRGGHYSILIGVFTIADFNLWTVGFYIMYRYIAVVPKAGSLYICGPSNRFFF